jgi:hypothetical protein
MAVKITPISGTFHKIKTNCAMAQKCISNFKNQILVFGEFILGTSFDGIIMRISV